MAAPSSFKIVSGTTRSIFPVNPTGSQSGSNQSNPSLLFPKKTRVSPSLTISTSPPPQTAAEGQERDGGRGGRAGAITEKRLEKWMKGSVGEIVKNIKKAPLLVQVFADGEEEEIRAEHAAEEEWEWIKLEWEKGQRRLPDGIIYVEELSGLQEYEVAEEEDDDGETKVWGIVVQGRGGGGGDGSSPVCYLLKTTRVSGGVGLGLFCTHFSLIRVTSFRETALSQFNNFWLVSTLPLNWDGPLQTGISLNMERT